MFDPKTAARYLAQEAGLPVNGDKPEPPEYRLRVHEAADIEPQQVTWLWPKRLPVGKVALLAGDPGLGKSYLTLAIATAISLGAPWPDGAGEAPKGNVLLVSCEDGMADPIIPRLRVLGAALPNVRLIEAQVKSDDDDRALSLVDHLRLIESAVLDFDATLLVLDPILAFTGSKDTHRSSDVRAVMAPLAGMAEQTGCTVLAVIHLNKKSGELNSVYRLTGSLDFAAAARSVMVVGKHPEADEHRVLAPVKMNLSAMPNSLTYTFTDEGAFAWGDSTELDANAILVTQDPAEKGVRGQAKELLADLLGDGEMLATAVWDAVAQEGYSRETVKRAANELGVHKYQITGQTPGRTPGKAGTAGWVWSLSPKATT